MAYHQQPAVDHNQLRGIFEQIDKDRSGCLSPKEIQQALSNGTWEPFSLRTVGLLIKLFNRSNTGSLNYEEFTQIWGYITQWQGIFRQYDRMNSSRLQMDACAQALQQFGYRLSQQFVQVFMQAFDRERQGSLLFDEFLGACISLQLLTDQFKKKDTGMKGVATFQYEEFLSAVFSTFGAC